MRARYIAFLRYGPRLTVVSASVALPNPGFIAMSLCGFLLSHCHHFPLLLRLPPLRCHH